MLGELEQAGPKAQPQRLIELSGPLRGPRLALELGGGSGRGDPGGCLGGAGMQRPARDARGQQRTREQQQSREQRKPPEVVEVQRHERVVKGPAQCVPGTFKRFSQHTQKAMQGSGHMRSVEAALTQDLQGQPASVCSALGGVPRRAWQLTVHRPGEAQGDPVQPGGGGQNGGPPGLPTDSGPKGKGSAEPAGGSIPSRSASCARSKPSWRTRRS